MEVEIHKIKFNIGNLQNVYARYATISYNFLNCLVCYTETI